MENVTLAQALRDGVTLPELLKNLKLRIQKTTSVSSPMEKGEYISKHFPQMAAETIALADEALAGMMVLPGTNAKLHFVGNPPLWSDNPPKDSEYTYHLNRMHHWKTMCEAYTLTGNMQYAEKVVQEMLNWIETCPCPSLKATNGEYSCDSFGGLGLWRALEVGIRGYRTWPMVLELLIDSGCITEQFLEKLIPCIYLHCKILYEISPLLWPKADHNHYLMENLGLLSFTCMFPELRHSEEMKAHAERELDRCIDAQCTSSGGQIEGCPSYHNGCVFWFGLRLVLADKYNLAVSSHYSNLVRSMFVFAVHATRACGGNFPWGDSHTAKKETMSLAAVACYMAFNEREFLAIGRYFYPYETIVEDLRDNLWRLRNLQSLKDDLQWADNNPQQPSYETFAWQTELDQVYIRTDWSREALSVMTGCRTPVQNQHAHMDPGGFDFNAYGATLINDPGIFTYKDCEDRHNFKGTLWHSCLTINRKDAWEYISSWEYGPQQEGKIIAAQQLPRVSYALSRHLNYNPAIATRLLALIDNSFLLVLDYVKNVQPKSSVEIGFHVDRTQLSLLPSGAYSSEENAPNLLICASGEYDNIALENARISTSGDTAHDSRIVRYSKQMPTGGCYTQATVLLPLRPNAASGNVIKPMVTQNGENITVELMVLDKKIKLLLSDDTLSII